MRPPVARTGVRAAGWAAAAAGSLLLTGCLVIPVSYTQAGSRHNVSDTTARGFQPGITTREDVLLQLGEPDYVSIDGRRLGYAWTEVHAVLFVSGSSGPGATDEMGKTSVLEVSFDAEGRMEASRVISKGMWFGVAVPPSKILEAEPPQSAPHK
jgi:outer membrane protein assembly factor BamE (lipoprotein component of BamABCDE complex)